MKTHISTLLNRIKQKKKQSKAQDNEAKKLSPISPIPLTLRKTLISPMLKREKSPTVTIDS
ncbi:MAG: hypothetical protein ABFQ62_01975 [Patescibacteria group bacterium]